MERLKNFVLKRPVSDLKKDNQKTKSGQKTSFKKT
jgi:hypothetical protein